MATQAVFGKGTLLQVETATPGTYITIPECRAIRAPSADREQLDATSHDSTGAAREFVGGLVDFGEVVADCNYRPDDTIHQQCIADAASTTSVARNFRIRMVGTRSVDFAGYVQRFERNYPHDNLYRGDISIKVSGQPTENPSP